MIMTGGYRMSEFGKKFNPLKTAKSNYFMLLISSFLEKLAEIHFYKTNLKQNTISSKDLHLMKYNKFFSSTTSI